MPVYHVYILAGANGVLYTGVTNDLERRVQQHKQKLVPRFTARHDVVRLVFFEPHSDIRAAIIREKRSKAGGEKRLALICSLNSEFRDLGVDFHK